MISNKFDINDSIKDINTGIVGKVCGIYLSSEGITYSVRTDDVEYGITSHSEDDLVLVEAVELDNDNNDENSNNLYSELMRYYGDHRTVQVNYPRLDRKERCQILLDYPEDWLKEYKTQYIGVIHDSIVYGQGLWKIENIGTESSVNTKTQWKEEGRCPQCGELGHIHNFAMVCSEHGPY